MSEFLEKYKNGVSDKNPDKLKFQSQNHRKHFSSLSFTGKINLLVQLSTKTISAKEFAKTIRSYTSSEEEIFELFRSIAHYASELEQEKESLEAEVYGRKSLTEILQ